MQQGDPRPGFGMLVRHLRMLDEVERSEAERGAVTHVEDVASRLLELLAKRSDVDLAEACGVAQGFVAAMEGGRPSSAQALAEALAVVLELTHRRREGGG